MLELLKLLFSKDFVANAKDIIALINRSKSWRKDIVKLSGHFHHSDRIESTVLIKESIKTIGEKGWSKEEQKETEFILQELFDNSFEYGIHDKKDAVKANLTITSTFLKASVTDSGVMFNLLQELASQEAFNPGSDKHRGLSFINKITPEISQEKDGDKNTVIVIKRQGIRPLKITTEGSVLIFNLSNSGHVTDLYFKAFTDRITAVAPNTNIIIDFTENQPKHTMAIRSIRETLVSAKQTSNLNIVVCGLDDAPFVIREYFENKFPTFAYLYEALDFLETH